MFAITTTVAVVALAVTARSLWLTRRDRDELLDSLDHWADRVQELMHAVEDRERQLDELGDAAIRMACRWQEEKDGLLAEIGDLTFEAAQYAEEINRLAEQDGEWFGADECLSCGARMDAADGATICDRCGDQYATDAILAD